MKIVLAVIGALIFVSRIVGSTGDGNSLTPFLISVFAIVAGGVVAVLVRPPTGRRTPRYLLGALAGACVGQAVLAAMAGSFDAGAIGYFVGRSLGDWAILGGGSALIVNAFPHSPKASVAPSEEPTHRTH